VLFPWR